MPTAICTLFEGNYHYGLASLVNSIHKYGFKGHIYAGYRGEIPFWAKNIKTNETLNWVGAKTCVISNEIELHFLPVNTEYHFTNYKPKFMLSLLSGPAEHLDGLFYFDPDITNKCEWSFYERWISYGVAIIHEVIWNDMPATHPKRHQWASVAKSINLPVRNTLTSYFSAGFIGISRNRISFLEMWDTLINTSAKYFEYNVSAFSQNQNSSYIFTVGDQDLLNLTLMCTDHLISEIGPDGMDFVYGGWIMSHAMGSPKPWNKKYLYSAFLGIPPSMSDKLYWENSVGVIRAHNTSKIYYKKLSVKLSSFLGRFYRRVTV